jgi:hypothetical protein
MPFLHLRIEAVFHDERVIRLELGDDGEGPIC